MNSFRMFVQSLFQISSLLGLKISVSSKTEESILDKTLQPVHSRVFFGGKAILILLCQSQFGCLAGRHGTLSLPGDYNESWDVGSMHLHILCLCCNPEFCSILDQVIKFMSTKSNGNP